MRIRSIRLRDFRGTGDRRVAFPEQGVTIVEGPNEAGKSSLAEALDLLFSHLDSSRAQAVLSVQPVDRDAGPEVEAEIEAGRYRFRYRKRFLKRPETVLEVRAPAPETLRGREAHERANAILDETIDRHLWRALRVQQGSAVDQASFADAPSLARTLDRTAGKETAGDRELTLFERVSAEYERYFTPRDRQPRKSVRDLEARALDALRRVADLERDWGALESDVEKSAELERRIPEFARDARGHEARLGGIERDVRELEKRAVSGPVEIGLRMARVNEAHARKEREDRTELVDRLRAGRRRVEELEAAAARGAPALETAQAAARRAAEALAEAEEQAAKAEKLHELREKDLNYQHFRLDLEQLREREQRVRAARDEAAGARAFLDRTRVTAERLARVREANLALERAQARLDAGSPLLSLRALRDVEVELDGERRGLAAGEELERAVAGTAALRVADLLEVRVAAGTGELRAARDAARRGLDSLLGEAGVATPAEAEEEDARRRDAERTAAECARKIEENLRDLSPAELRAKIERLDALVRKYPEERTGMPAIAPDYEAAKSARHAARETLDRSLLALKEARRRHGALDAEERGLRETVAEAHLELRVAHEKERQAEADLAQARRRRPDAAVDAALHEAVERLTAAQEAYDAARRAAEERSRAQEAAAEARRQLEEARARLRAHQDELRDVAARLDLLGERGLFEELETARTLRTRAQHERAAVERRAAAARLLFETMGSKREDARRAYAEPLESEIRDLGRLVFGDSFAVELDDELRVRTRTLDGKTLAWDQLSVGAREQLGLVARLACARLVDPSDGVPLLFDDTLGHTDPERLRGMAATIRRAGERCQLVLLTCTPGRFAEVEEAHRVQLAPGA